MGCTKCGDMHKLSMNLKAATQGLQNGQCLLFLVGALGWPPFDRGNLRRFLVRCFNLLSHKIEKWNNEMSRSWLRWIKYRNWMPPDCIYKLNIEIVRIYNYSEDVAVQSIIISWREIKWSTNICKWTCIRSLLRTETIENHVNQKRSREQRTSKLFCVT